MYMLQIARRSARYKSDSARFYLKYISEAVVRLID